MLNEKQRAIILAFADNDMSLTKTASAVFYSAANIQHYLRKIAQLTGLDPKRFYDLVVLVKRVKEGKL